MIAKPFARNWYQKQTFDQTIADLAPNLTQRRNYLHNHPLMGHFLHFFRLGSCDCRPSLILSALLVGVFFGVSSEAKDGWLSVVATAAPLWPTPDSFSSSMILVRYWLSCVSNRLTQLRKEFRCEPLLPSLAASTAKVFSIFLLSSLLVVMSVAFTLLPEEVLISVTNRQIIPNRYQWEHN